MPRPASKPGSSGLFTTIGMTIAQTKTNASQTIARIPPKPIRCARARTNRSSAGAPTGASGGAGGSVAAALGECSSITNPRIEDRIEHVDGDVHEHVPHGDHRHQALELDELTPEDREEQELPHTGELEQ